MGQIFIQAAELTADRVVRLRVEMHGQPPRTIDRETAIRWMRDGHSMLTRKTKIALQLVEVGEDAHPYIRNDNAPIAADALPSLPPMQS